MRQPPPPSKKSRNGEVFWSERRTDLRLSLASGGPLRREQTFTCGSVEEGPGFRRFGAETAATPVIDADGIDRRLAELLEPLGEGAVASWVAFEQRVRGRSGGREYADLRRSSWWRLRQHGVTVDGSGEEDPVRLLSDLVAALARPERVRAAAGPTAAVFAPAAGGILIHELVGHALEGRSHLGPAGRRIAPEHVSVFDDPGRGRAAWSIDDEGNPARRVCLVDRGCVRDLMHDVRSAERHAAAPTGHGRRASFREPVLPRMGCTWLAPGGLSPQQVLGETRRGIHVRRMQAAHVDLSRGVAWLRVTDASRIDHGQLAEPLEPLLLRVETNEALASLDCIANDLTLDATIGSCLRDAQPMTASVGTPTFRIGLATVA